MVNVVPSNEYVLNLILPIVGLPDDKFSSGDMIACCWQYLPVAT